MDLTVKGLQLSEAILQEFGLGEAPYVNPQEVALQKLLTGSTEPWEKEHYKWRITRLKDQTALAGEPGAGNGPPVDSKGNLIPVLPAREWIKKNPSIVKEMPNEALPPELRKPSMLDKIGGAVKGIRNSIVDYANRETELDQQIRQNREDVRREYEDALRSDPMFSPPAVSDNELPKPRRLKENVELDRIKTLTSKVLTG
jgi:hypothetical protein